MSAYIWPKPHAVNYRELAAFGWSEALPTVSPSQCPAHFLESTDAQQHYSAYRSGKGSFDTKTYHAIEEESGRVAGFISFTITQDEGTKPKHVFVHVDYAYVLPSFRMYGMGMLAPALLEQVLSALRQVKIAGDLEVFIHFRNDSLAPCDKRFTALVEDQLVALTRRHAGARFLGQYLEDPPGARQRLLSRQLGHMRPDSANNDQGAPQWV